eukprot:TRINITY_DN8025_c0_g1_i1.p1 TRINITY_DN8025_c0_g1~~TRINITY_DN8025_c0_g1_i1.p1  ORF type:complete len:511 (+),score=55.25 TRINITY_DN8025_c0_g1_i1:151-1683(+)
MEPTLPPGFFKEDDVTCRPKAVVRSVKSTFGGSSENDLVAVQHIKPGETVLEERAIIEWGKTVEITGKDVNDQEKVLGQRIAAIMKMSQTMPTMSGISDFALPPLQAYLTATSRGISPDGVWEFPWVITDSHADQEALKYRVGFGVLAFKGLSKTIHEQRFSDHTQLSRLFTIAERGGIPTPYGTGLFRFCSVSKRIKKVKTPLVSVGCRPGKRKTETAKIPTPNCDYTFTDDGTLVLKARRQISFGEIITIPLNKHFEPVKQSALDVLRDKAKLADAALHQAKSAKAPQILKDYAKARHPRIAPRPKLISAPSINFRARNVTAELWSEVVSGRVENPLKSFTFLVDYTFDKQDCEVITLAAESRSGGSTQSVPFHLGFENNCRTLSSAIFAPVMQTLFQRAASKFPRSFTTGSKNVQLVGSSETATFFRLTPGEEILPFRMNPSCGEGTYGVPMLLSLGGSGKVVIGDSTLLLKEGRIIVWSGDLKHSVPVCRSGDAIIALTYMIYKES